MIKSKKFWEKFSEPRQERTALVLPKVKHANTISLNSFNIRSMKDLHSPSELLNRNETSNICKDFLSPQTGRAIQKLKKMLNLKTSVLNKSREIVPSDIYSLTQPKCEKCPRCGYPADFTPIKNALKPFITDITDKPDSVSISHRILNIQNVNQGLLTEENSENLDKAIEMLLNNEIPLTKVMSYENIEKLKKSCVFNALVFYEKEECEKLFKEMLKKSQYYSDLDKKECKISQKFKILKKSIKDLSPKKICNESEILGITLFACVQELVHEMTLLNPNRGNLLIRALSEFLKLNEEKWSLFMNSCLQIIRVLEQENAKPLNKSDAEKDLILNKNELSSENLSQHKQIIRQQCVEISELNAKIAELTQTQKSLKNELNSWIIDYDILKSSKIIKEKLEQYSYKNIIDMFNFNSQYFFDIYVT